MEDMDEKARKRRKEEEAIRKGVEEHTVSTSFILLALISLDLTYTIAQRKVRGADKRNIALFSNRRRPRKHIMWARARCQIHAGALTPQRMRRLGL